MNASNVSVVVGALCLTALVFGCASGSQTSAVSTQPAATTVPAPPPPVPAGVQPPSPGEANGQFEQPPIVNVSQLLPSTALSGPGFSVQPQAPTNGAMGQYTIVGDQSVFRSDAGTYYVESLDLLKIRLSEVPAIAQLDSMSETGVFAREFASSAARPVTDAAQMVEHPMDSVQGLPGGVGELFQRVSLGGKEVYSAATNSPGSGEAAAETGRATMTALGYDQVRRDLARKLHVDPYTSNPILTKKLNKMAWVMFSARLTVDAAMMAVPASIVVSGVEFSDDLVYQTPKADLIVLVQKKLRKMGLSQEEIAAFSSNTAIPLSLQVSGVRELETLGNIPGRRATAIALGDMMTEYQARFMVTSLHMLNQWSQQRSRVTKIQVEGILVARDQNGTNVVPAPIDYLSWTSRTAGFATDPNLLAMHNRVVWIPSQMTPLAQKQLAVNGWQIKEGTQP